MSSKMKHVGAKCQNRDCHASNVLVSGRRHKGRSGTLVWRAAKGRLHWIVLAGMCLHGGRSKAPIDHAALRRAGEGRPCLPAFWPLYLLLKILMRPYGRFRRPCRPTNQKRNMGKSSKHAPKPFQNRFQIDDPQNMHFFNAFWLVFYFNIFDFMKICIFP